MKTYVRSVVLVGFFLTLLRADKPVIVGNQRRLELASQQASDRGEQLFKKGFNKEKKEQEIQGLVERAVLYLEKHDLSDACLKFARQKEFVAGDAYLFVCDSQGKVLADGEQPQLIYTNQLEAKDSFGFSYMKEIIRMASSGGGWVTYAWRDAVKVSYVKQVKKNGEVFIVGAGYYPHAKENFVVSMVKGAVSLFNDLVIDKGYPVTEPFSTMNYPRKSKASFGDLYLYALDFNGDVFVHADRPELAMENNNMLDYQDSLGKFINKEVIKVLQTEQSYWSEYMSKKASKRTYMEKVTDKEGKNYFIACGYYPDANQEKAEALVGEAASYMEGHGKSEAFRAFTSQKDDRFRYGDLYIVVYDLLGKVVAHGWSEALVDKVLLNNQDQDGRFYVKELIDLAQKGGGWINVKLHNSFQSIYAELVELGLEKFVVTSSFYPISKPDSALLLLESACSKLKANNVRDTFRLFSQLNGPFIRGDLKIFVIDLNGICYVWGDNHRLIWKNIRDWKDQKGHPFIQYIIDTSAKGLAKVAYTFNNEDAVAIARRVEIDGQTYIVGSNFYW